MSNKDKPDDKDYAVGYCKPPAQTQFKKGQSGNPKGRPTGKSNLATSLNRALNEKVTILENGQRRTISKLDAAVKQVINKAAAGDGRAFQQIVNLKLLLAEDDHVVPVIPTKETDNKVMARLLLRMKADNGIPPADAACTDESNSSATASVKSAANDEEGGA